MMDFLPINVQIGDGKILIVGGGKVATHKAAILSRFTDNVVVIADKISDGIKALPFRWKERKFVEDDLVGFRLVFICTDNRELNHVIKRKANEHGLLASVCDDPEYCDFVSPAIAKFDNLTIAVGTDRKQVRRAIAVRDRIEKEINNGNLQID